MRIRQSRYSKFAYVALFVAFFFSTIIHSPSKTLQSIPLIGIYLYCFCQSDFWKNKRKNTFLIFSLYLSILILILHGIMESKDYILYITGIFALEFFIEKYGYKSSYIYYYLIWITIPTIGLGVILWGATPTFIPVDNTVNVYGLGTKHGTASLGYIMCIGILFRYWVYKQIRIKLTNMDKSIFAIGVYLIFFSGSRSVPLALVSVVVLYYINKSKFHEKLTWVFCISLLTFTYFIEIIGAIPYFTNTDNFLTRFMHIDQLSQGHSLSSGRNWLWSYHWNAFINSRFLLGEGRSVTDFSVGDWIGSLRVEAIAGSESVYTSYLAGYGLIGIYMLSILVYLLWKAIKNKNAMACCIIFGSIYNANMGLDYTDPLSKTSIFCYLMYYTALRIQSIKEQKLKFYHLRRLQNHANPIRRRPKRLHHYNLF